LGKADIIDVKNPKEGPLGASFPWVIREIKSVLPESIELSCTLGDIPSFPGTTSLAAYGAASLGANYVKASLYAMKNDKEAICTMKSVVNAMQFYPSVKVVVAGFADAFKVGSIDPLLIPKIANAANCDIAMLDTAVKDGSCLFDYLEPERIRSFIDESHQFGLQAALAGSLKKEDLANIGRMNVDIVGVRGAVCTNGDRVNGRIAKENILEIIDLLKLPNIST
jgi:(5-formylfuran-3-yl)methyl phosphate synthase